MSKEDQGPLQKRGWIPPDTEDLENPLGDCDSPVSQEIPPGVDPWTLC